MPTRASAIDKELQIRLNSGIGGQYRSWPSLIENLMELKQTLTVAWGHYTRGERLVLDVLYSIMEDFSLDGNREANWHPDAKLDKIIAIDGVKIKDGTEVINLLIKWAAVNDRDLDDGPAIARSTVTSIAYTLRACWYYGKPPTKAIKEFKSRRELVEAWRAATTPTPIPIPGPIPETAQRPAPKPVVTPPRPSPPPPKTSPRPQPEKPRDHEVRPVGTAGFKTLAPRDRIRTGITQDTDVRLLNLSPGTRVVARYWGDHFEIEEVEISSSPDRVSRVVSPQFRR